MTTTVDSYWQGAANDAVRAGLKAVDIQFVGPVEMSLAELAVWQGRPADAADRLTAALRLIDHSPEIRIGDGENVARGRLFVDEDPSSIADDLFFNFQDALAFEHHGEDVTGGRVLRIVLFDQLSQQGFRRFLLDRIRRRRRCKKNALPIGDESLPVCGSVAVLLLPAGLANVRAPEVGLLIEEQRVIRLLVNEALAASGAGVCGSERLVEDLREFLRR